MAENNLGSPYLVLVWIAERFPFVCFHSCQERYDLLFIKIVDNCWYRPFASVYCRGTALTMKKMLETAFPGIDVVLANHPPTFPKRLISKLVPVAQIGVVGLVVAGEQIFLMLGFMQPPPWYYSLRANRFGTIATTWLLGNTLQSFLQSTGAFEVYLNNELVSWPLLFRHLFRILIFLDLLLIVCTPIQNILCTFQGHEFLDIYTRIHINFLFSSRHSLVFFGGYSLPSHIFLTFFKR